MLGGDPVLGGDPPATEPQDTLGGRFDLVKCPTCNRPFVRADALARHRERTNPCAGTSRTRPGERCDTCLTKPKTVCRFHGGEAPQVKAAVERRRQTEVAERSVAKFALPTDVEPSTALLDSLYRWFGMTTYLAQMIGEFESDSELKQLSVGAEKYERPSVWVDLYRDALKEQSKVAKACLDAGIDERRMRLTEQHGRVLDGVIRKVVEGIFAGLLGAGMRADALEAFRTEQLPGIVRAAVMAIAYADPDAGPRGA